MYGYLIWLLSVPFKVQKSNHLPNHSSNKSYSLPWKRTECSSPKIAHTKRLVFRMFQTSVYLPIVKTFLSQKHLSTSQSCTTISVRYARLLSGVFFKEANKHNCFKQANKYNCTNRRQAQIIIICTVFFMKMLVVGAPTSIKEMKCQIFQPGLGLDTPFICQFLYASAIFSIAHQKCVNLVFDKHMVYLVSQ